MNKELNCRTVWFEYAKSFIGFYACTLGSELGMGPDMENR